MIGILVGCSGGHIRLAKLHTRQLGGPVFHLPGAFMPSREFKPKWVDSTIKSYQVSQVQFESATITLIINTHLLYLYGHLQGFGPTSNKF